MVITHSPLRMDDVNNDVIVVHKGNPNGIADDIAVEHKNAIGITEDLTGFVEKVENKHAHGVKKFDNHTNHVEKTDNQSNAYDITDYQYKVIETGNHRTHNVDKIENQSNIFDITDSQYNVIETSNHQTSDVEIADSHTVIVGNHKTNSNVDSPDGNHAFVELKPFVNQVGGHTCVLEIDHRTICKPYVEREVWFYQNVPDAMKEFTPRYYGDIDVKYDVAKGSKRLVACIPTHLMKERRHSRNSGDVTMTCSSKRGKKRGHGSLERISHHGCEQTREDDVENSRSIPETSEGCRLRPEEAEYNRWSVQCLERQITRYGFWANNQPQKFIMMGNLVSDYTYPCMMDIKMGRRQYGDDSSEEKRKLLEKRCAKSTSGTLGFRICGTQVYQCASDSYVVHDKYYGRYLDEVGVANELKFFFHNGLSLRSNVISCIIQKLEKLKGILQTEKRLNLYSCSLLLIYDGNTPRDQPDMTSYLATGNEEGQVKNGIRNKTHPCTSAINDIETSNSGPTDSRPIHSTRSDTESLFDVRLIDFAHVSEKNDDESRDADEENNIVFGLTKLIGILQEMVA